MSAGVVSRCALLWRRRDCTAAPSWPVGDAAPRWWWCNCVTDPWMVGGTIARDDFRPCHHDGGACPRLPVWMSRARLPHVGRCRSFSTAPNLSAVAIVIAAAVNCMVPGAALVAGDDGRTWLVWGRELTADEANRVHAYVIRLLKAAGA